MRVATSGLANHIKFPKDLKKLPLSDDASRYFKCVFSRQIEEEYNLSSLDLVKDSDGKRLNKWQKNELRRILFDFLAICTRKTISEVNAEYGRSDDAGDAVYDTEDETVFPTKHYNLCPKGYSGYGNFARIHGHYNENADFVLTRVDWGHRYHHR